MQLMQGQSSLACIFCRGRLAHGFAMQCSESPHQLRSLQGLSRQTSKKQKKSETFSVACLQKEIAPKMFALKPRMVRKAIQDVP